MKIKHLFAAMLFAMTALCAVAQGEMQMQMPPIPVDEAVRIGKLDNGLTYYIRHNDYPEHRVNFYIAQRVGSLQEEESQRGLAHFLEHMAFNGSEHFNGEGKSIIDYTRSLGVSFGRDLNAYTSIAETVYNIDNVPSTRQSAIDSCLLILKDWSNGLLLEDEEIDKERGVIHEEWRLRMSPSQRMLERNLETLYPGSKYGRRMPIGLMSVVDNFKYKELRDYYHKWYRPDNQALVIVGDVDVDHIEAKIKELFSGIPVQANAAQVVDEPVPDNEQAIIVVDKDKEQQFSNVMVMFKHDALPKEEKTTMAYLIVDYAKDMVATMLNQRLAEKAQEPDCPFLQAQAGDGEYLFSNTKDAFELYGVPKEGQTEATTQAMVIEALRAAKYGFTATEYARAKEEYLSQLEKQYNERNKIPNGQLARQYYRNYLDNDPMPSIEQAYQIMNQIVPMVPVEVINQMLPELISNNDKNLVIVNFNQEKDGAVYPTATSLRAAIDAAHNAEIEAYVDNVKQEPLISQLPTPGKIVKETENTTLGYKELELSNGARVILKKTDFKDNEILMTASQRGGKSLYGPEDRANIDLLGYATMMSGLGEFSSTELDKALAGKQAQTSLNMSTYQDQVSGQSTVKDLETLFQLTYLRFTDIRKDEKSYNNMLSLLENALKNRDLQPEAVFEDSVNYILGNHSWRDAPFGVEDLKQANYDRILQIAKERTANAANYTFVFVGAIDEAAIRPLIEQYIASLPAQKGKPSKWNNVATYPKGQTVTHFTRKMETPKANSQIYWYSTDMPYSLENSVKARMLGQALSKIYLQKIREDQSAAYSAGASGYVAREGDNTCTMIYADCPFTPEKADIALNIMNDEIVKAGKTIDPTAMQEIKEVMLKDYDTNIKENRYWLQVLSTYMTYGTDSYSGYKQVVESQTPQTIADFARQIYNAGNKVEVVMMPAQ